MPRTPPVRISHSTTARALVRGPSSPRRELRAQQHSVSTSTSVLTRFCMTELKKQVLPKLDSPRVCGTEMEEREHSDTALEERWKYALQDSAGSTMRWTIKERVKEIIKETMETIRKRSGNDQGKKHHLASRRHGHNVRVCF